MTLRSRLRKRLEWADHPLTYAGEAEGVLAFHTATGQPVQGRICRPDGAGPWPVVLVLHAHGNRYDIGCDELTLGRPALPRPIGPELAAAGIASVCLDMPCFGARATVSESAATKAALWAGRSLAGQMLGESRAAVDWLAAQPWVRPSRIGAYGISMGATLGYWLAGLDPRIRAVAHECCLADFAALIALGNHDLHGIYLTVPGLVTLAPNGVIAGLAAPRAQFIGLGDLDPLTPPAAADIALAQVRAAYAARGGRLDIHREPAEGHRETEAMRAAAMAFLTRELS